jgi:N-methylhydantoinase A/oxoprolinase/acetone carboxylase beta subunit
MRVGADTGGTFTDVVSADGRSAKVLSSPDDPGQAVRAGVAALVADARPSLLAHGTTVATNALLEGTGAPVALLTTAGLRDVIEIARQDRPSLYDRGVVRPSALVPRDWRLAVSGRLDASGAELQPVDLEAVPVVPHGAVGVAVCLLHADLEPGH